MKYLAAAIIATSLLCITPFTRADTIDFGNTPGHLLTTTYTEDNFQFTVLSGNTWAIVHGAGNPPSSLAAGANTAVGIGDTISVMQLGGGLFSFTALDFASSGNALSDGVSLVGFVNGVQTEMFSNLSGSTTTFLTLNPLFLTPIDELRIVGASQGSETLLLDNFVFNPVRAAVPETASTMVLMVCALAALLVWRRLVPSV